MGSGIDFEFKFYLFSNIQTHKGTLKASVLPMSYAEPCKICIIQVFYKLALYAFFTEKYILKYSGTIYTSALSN